MCFINSKTEISNPNTTIEVVPIENVKKESSTCKKVARIVNDIFTMLGAALLAAGVILSVSGTIATACSCGAGFPVLISGIVAACIGITLTLGTKLIRDHLLEGATDLKV